MADKDNDPAVIWKTMIGEMEKGFNTFANRAMESPEYSKMMNQAGGVAAGVQKQLGELSEKYLTSMNLPSRSELIDLGERLHNIEGRLNDIMSLLQRVHADVASADGAGGVPRPPRTQRPPSKTGGPP